MWNESFIIIYGWIVKTKIYQFYYLSYLLSLKMWHSLRLFFLIEKTIQTNESKKSKFNIFIGILFMREFIQRVVSFIMKIVKEWEGLTALLIKSLV